MSEQSPIDRLTAAVDDRVPPRFDGLSDRLTYLLAEYKLAIYAAVIAAAVLIGTGRAEVDVPPELETFLFGVAIGIIPAVFLGFRLVDRWMSDPRVKVLLFDPDRPAVEPKRIPRGLWEDKEVEDMPVWTVSEGSTEAIITDMRHNDATDTLTVTGCNPELADPVSIAARDGRLTSVFEDLANRVSELQSEKHVRAAREVEVEANAVNELVAAVEDAARFEQEEIELEDLAPEDAGNLSGDDAKTNGKEAPTTADAHNPPEIPF